jgi:hypothetical protein
MVLNSLSDEMESNVDMFGARVIIVIVGEMERSLVVAVE